MGIYVKQDYRKCFDLLTVLYENRNHLVKYRARRDLIFCYANGIGTEKDFEKAYRLVHEEEADSYDSILPLFRSLRPAFLYPYDRISEEFLTFCRTEKKDPGFEIGYALYRCKDDGERVRLPMKHQYDCDCGFLCQGELGKYYLDGLYGLEKNGSAAFICFWLANRYAQNEFGRRAQGFEDIDKTRLCLAECYDKGIGTNVNPNACAAILSEIVYGYRQSIDDFECGDIDYVINYDWCLGPSEENYYEKLLENDLFKKYESEIEKRVNLEEEGLVDDELIDISNLPFDPKTYY